MITHGIHELMDDLRMTWCGIKLAPEDPRPKDDDPIDCMTCLIRRVRTEAWFDVWRKPNDGVTSVNPDGSFNIDFKTRGVRRWR